MINIRPDDTLFGTLSGILSGTLSQNPGTGNGSLKFETQTTTPKTEISRAGYGAQPAGDLFGSARSVRTNGLPTSKREHVQRVQGLYPGSEGQNLALTVFYMTSSLGRGLPQAKCF